MVARINFKALDDITTAVLQMMGESCADSLRRLLVSTKTR